MAERHFQKRVIKWIREQPHMHCLNVVGGAMQRSGEPDLVICWKGRFIGLELKYGKGKPTPLQLHRLRQWEEAGGWCGVAWDLDDVKQVVYDSVDQVGGEARLYPHRSTT